ncbi:uncharacterized protein LOC110107067 [Dendrobium catenatum]|uniref:Uncharacterized protein n=1 Tax=Dendrobium catenatum TaxID=906689 RepID=A0A2I0W933_9ASPA|nr:uncharacterized protein LOC110107067 [Dendrobium catenatum]PKU72165.1 hypothetical protein MA16_Dca006758 [Dendrobium catenatum]
MERKQGFLSALRELSPGRSRSYGLAIGGVIMPRRKNWLEPPPVVRSGGEALAPLMEGPDPGDGGGGGCGEGRRDGWGQWMRTQLSKAPVASGGHRRSDLRLLLGVMGAPLAPVHVCFGEPLPHLSIKDTPIETSSAQYILQQYTAASGGIKLLSSIHNSYVMGKMKMVASEFETSTRVMKNRNASRDAESGGFVLWLMAPEMWYVELAVGTSKIHAGCNGKIVWRHTPWLGAHAAKGPVRPLRRVLQGLDPLTTASMFANAQCIGEKTISGEDCFILKLFADPQTLKARSEGPSEIIRHVMFGYFSQKTGLLIHMEDSHLTRIQSSSGGEAVYWETTISSFLDDYRAVEGVMIAHCGRSIVTLFRFGEMAMSHTKTRMEEEWTIEEVAFNVPGLSIDCFIPPADLKCNSVSETCELSQRERGKSSVLSFNRSKVAAVEKKQQHNITDTVLGIM